MYRLLGVFILVSLVLAACNTNQENKSDSTSDDAGLNNAASPIQISVISTAVTLEENRVVIALWDGENRVADAQSITVVARDNSVDGNPIVWQGDAENFSDYPIPYWVIYPELPRAGAWIMQAAVVTADSKVYSGTVPVNVYESPRGVTVGAQAVPSITRTWDGTGDLADITSDLDPNPAYYEQTLADALSGDNPVVVVFSTPGLCASKICAPVMDTIDPLWATYQDTITFVHVEVYADFETLEWVDAMYEWGLLSEPWVYVIGADDTVVARFEGPLATSELEPVLQAVLE